MLNSFYLFFIPFIIVCIYISVKFFLHKEEIDKLGINVFVDDDDLSDNFEEAKEKVFVFVESLKIKLMRLAVIFFHWLLHFFVIFLKFISDFTDVLYARARDFFLKTASKEKSAVNTFWHHLKEYKKEKEEEQEEK